MKTLIGIADRITASIGLTAAVIVVPIIVTTCYEVFARYVLGSPTIWAFELGYMLTGAHFMLGAALTLQRRGHVRIDLIYDRLPERRKAVIDLVCYVVLFLPFTLLLSQALWKYMAASYVSGEGSGQSAWNPPVWPFRAVLFLGIALLSLQVVSEILKCLRVLRGKAGSLSETR